MDAERIKEIRARVEAAPAGPWRVCELEGKYYRTDIEGPDEDDAQFSASVGCGPDPREPSRREPTREEDPEYFVDWHYECVEALAAAEFITEARQDVPDLLDAYEEAERIARNIKGQSLDRGKVICEQLEEIAALRSEVERLQAALEGKQDG